MILYKITTCPAKAQVGIYQHESNDLSFGNGEADVVIDDPALNSKQVQITLKKGQFYVANVGKKVAVRLNGVEISSKLVPIKANDSLSMGDTTIFFTQINDKPLAHPPAYVNEQGMARIQRDGSDENAIHRALNHLSGDENSPPALPPKKE